MGGADGVQMPAVSAGMRVRAAPGEVPAATTAAAFPVAETAGLVRAFPQTAVAPENFVQKLVRKKK